jgi:hypothetical protein
VHDFKNVRSAKLFHMSLVLNVSSARTKWAGLEDCCIFKWSVRILPPDSPCDKTNKYKSSGVEIFSSSGCVNYSKYLCKSENNIRKKLTVVIGVKQLDEFLLAGKCSKDLLFVAVCQLGVFTVALDLEKPPQIFQVFFISITFVVFYLQKVIVHN